MHLSSVLEPLPLGKVNSSFRLSFWCQVACLRIDPLTVLGYSRGVKPLLEGDSKGVPPLGFPNLWGEREIARERVAFLFGVLAQVSQELCITFGLPQTVEQAFGAFNEVCRVGGYHGHHAPQEPYLLQGFLIKE